MNQGKSGNVATGSETREFLADLLDAVERLLSGREQMAELLFDEIDAGACHVGGGRGRVDLGSIQVYGPLSLL